MNLSGRHAFNKKDAWLTWGVVVEKGSDDFLKPRKRKPSTSYVWKDRDGTQYDLSQPYFEERKITLNIALIAESEDDFWQKHISFFKNELEAPGVIRLYINEFSRSFYIFYEDCTQITRLTRIKINGIGKVACKYQIVFTEPDPNPWNKTGYLLDVSGKPLLNNDNSKILV